MKRLLATGLLVAALAGPAETAVAADSGTLRGRVFDITCFGPCTTDPEQRPFMGEGAVVIARRVASGEVARRIPVEKSRFHAQLRPGRYELTVKLEEDYWESDSARVRIQPEEVARAELHVTNTLIL